MLDLAFRPTVAYQVLPACQQKQTRDAHQQGLLTRPPPILSASSVRMVCEPDGASTTVGPLDTSTQGSCSWCFSSGCTSAEVAPSSQHSRPIEAAIVGNDEMLGLHKKLNFVLEVGHTLWSLAARGHSCFIIRGKTLIPATPINKRSIRCQTWW